MLYLIFPLQILPLTRKRSLPNALHPPSPTPQVRGARVRLHGRDVRRRVHRDGHLRRHRLLLLHARAHLTPGAAVLSAVLVAALRGVVLMRGRRGGGTLSNHSEHRPYCCGILTWRKKKELTVQKYYLSPLALLLQLYILLLICLVQVFQVQTYCILLSLSAACIYS